MRNGIAAGQRPARPAIDALTCRPSTIVTTELAPAARSAIAAD
jgi:hypothetical protein